MLTPSEVAAKLAPIQDRLGQTIVDLQGVEASLDALRDEILAPDTGSVLHRGLFWYTPDAPPAKDVYSDFVFQRSLTIQEQIRSVIASAYIYVTPIARRGSDSDGWTQLLKPAQVPDSWLYKNSSAGKISRVRNAGTEYFINPGNPDYIAAVKGQAPQVIGATGADGVMIDEIDEYPTWPFSSATNISPATHQANNLAFLRGVVPAFRAQGLRVMVNLGANLWPVSSYVNQVVDAVDEVWLEQFIGRQLNGVQAPATIGDQWEQQIQFLMWMQKPFTVNVAHSAQDVIDFGFLSYLLVANESSCFVSQPKGNGTPASPTQGLLDQASRLGSPTAPVNLNLSGGYASRTFQRGTVFVYPTSANWRLGRISLV